MVISNKLFSILILIALASVAIGYSDEFEFKTILPDYRPAASKANDDSGYFMITQIRVQSKFATRLQKFNPNGFLLWEKVMVVKRAHIFPVKVLSTLDGGAIIVSHFINAFEKKSTYVSLYSSSGYLQWMRKYSDLTVPMGIFLADSFIYLLGTDENENGLTLRLSLDGSVISKKSLDEIDVKSIINDGVMLNNGNIALIGETHNQDSRIHCFLAIFDPTLAIPKFINVLEGLQEARCYAIAQIRTGNIIVLGKTNTEPEGALILRFRIDSILEQKLRMGPKDFIKASFIQDSDYFLKNPWTQSELSSFEFSLIDVRSTLFVNPEKELTSKSTPFNSLLNGLIYLSYEALEQISEATENNSKKGLRLLTYCDLGWYSVCDTCTCVICEPGYFCNAGGSKYSCPLGNVCPGNGNSYARNCNVGYYIVSTAQDCVACSPGTSAAGNTYSCLACGPGTFSGYASPCLNCPCGTYSEAQGLTQSSSCTTCGSGYYSNAGSPSSGYCHLTPPGYYLTLDKCSVNPCPAGKYRSSSGGLYESDCSLCSTGTYSIQGSDHCTSCPAGSYSASTGASVCTSCLAGYYSATVGSSTNTCVICPAGTKCPTTGLANYVVCTPGTYQPEQGKTTCLTCPAGTGTTGSQSIACVDCEIGSYSSGGFCVPCLIGNECPTAKMTAASPCNPGYAQPSTGQSSCNECPVGTFAANPGSASCDPCAKGYYQPNAKSSSCLGCLPGEYQDETGKTACKDTQPGYYSGANAESQTPCAAGYFSDAIRTSTCKSCAAGYYQDQTGQTECKICAIGTWSGEHFATCTPCAKGYYEDTEGSTACKACPIGYYQDTTGQTECKICTFGTYASNTATEACTPCAAGYFEDLEGSIGCRPCDPGSFSSSTGQASCTECSAGTSQPQSGKTSCPPCAAGSYQTQIASTSCIPCEVGKSQSLTGKTSCDDCAAGNYQDVTGQATCKQCPAGQYQDLTGKTSCKNCDVGTYSNLGSTTCTPCAAGYYQDQPGKGSCKICPAGTYQPDIGKTSCIQCPAGTKNSAEGSTVSTDCTDCLAGSFSAAGAGTCTPCATGNYQPDPGKTSCIQCPVGKERTTTGGTTCTDCSAGYYADTIGTSNCKACAAGTYQDQIGQTGCKQCEVTKYQSSTGQAACIPCPAGTYENSLGSPLCKNCPAGQYQDQTGQSVCKNCDVGYSQPLTGKAICVACDAGYYQDQTGQANCKPCQLGKKQSLTGQTSCEDCPVAYYQDQTGKASCTICPAGKYNDQTGQAVCKDCNPGYYSDPGSTACLICPIGTYTGAGVGACIPCPPGTYNPSLGQGSCTNCPAGKYNPNEGSTDSSVCLDCGEGTYAPAGTGNCIPCEAGKFQPNPVQGSCLLCPAGEYQDQTGKTLCITCPAGSKCPTTGTPNHIPCPAGSYQPDTGKTSCISCEVGKFIGTTGNIVCTDCAAGYYQDLTGQSTCKECPAGKVQDITGQTFCKDCLVGNYQNALHMTVCLPCAAGTYADSPATANCKLCLAGEFQDETGKTLCEQCAVGNYQPDTGKASCLPCAAGTYQDQLGKASCIQCPTGKVQPLTGQNACDTCPVGYYQDQLGQSICKKCSAGTFQDAPGQASCKNCDPGYTSLEGATYCVKCFAGTYSAPGDGTCTPCPKGTYQPLEGQSSCTKCIAGTANPNLSSTVVGDCAPCTAGNYAPEGSEACLPCEAGTYQPDPAKGTCIDCPAGTYQDLTGKTFCNDCPIGSKCPVKSVNHTPCPAGSIQPEAKKDVCVDCPIGKYIGTSGQTACQSCAAGYYADVPGLAACKSCDPGTFQDQTEQSTCSKCPLGKEQPNAHATGCTDCALGYYADTEGTTNCKACPAGSFQDATGKSSCTQCSIGKEQPLTGKTLCTDCLVGYFQDEVGKASCKPCPAGTKQTATGQSTCENCPITYYQDQTGQTTCKICPVGTYGDAEGLPVCPPCPPGKVQPLTGQQTCDDCAAGSYAPGGTTACQTCPIGTAQPDPVKGSCNDCQAGYYQDLTGQLTCKACATGYAQPTPKQTSCTICGLGYYAPVPGTPSCLPCPAGSYTNQPGKASCTKCLAGYYQSNTAGSSCTKCPVGKYSEAPGWTECKIPNPGWTIKPNRDGQLFKGLFPNMDAYNADPMSKTCYDGSYKIIKPFTLACRDALRTICCTGATKTVGVDCNYALETEGLTDPMKDNYCKACPFMDQTKCPVDGVCWDETTWTTNAVSKYPATFTQSCLDAVGPYCIPRFTANLNDVECSLFAAACGATISKAIYTDGWTTFKITITKTLPPVLPACNTLFDTTFTPQLSTVSLTCTRETDSIISFTIDDTPSKVVRVLPTVNFKDTCGVKIPAKTVMILPVSGSFEVLTVNAKIVEKCVDNNITSAITEKYYPEPIKEQFWEVQYFNTTGVSAGTLSRFSTIGDFNKSYITIQSQDLIAGKAMRARSRIINAFDLETISNWLTFTVPLISEGRIYCGCCQLHDRSKCDYFEGICWNNYNNILVTRPTLTEDCKKAMASVCVPILLANENDPQCKDFLPVYNLDAMKIKPTLVSAIFAPNGRSIILRFSHPIRQNAQIDFNAAFDADTINWLPDPLTCTWLNNTFLSVRYNPEKGTIDKFTVLSGNFFYDYEYATNSVDTSTVFVRKPGAVVDIDLQSLNDVSECDNIDIFAILKTASLYRLVFKWSIEYSLPDDDQMYINAKEYFAKWADYSEISSVSIPSSLIRKNLTINIKMTAKAADVYSGEKLMSKIIKVYPSVPKIKFLSKAAYVLEFDGSKSINMPLEIQSSRCASGDALETDFMNIVVSFNVSSGSDPEFTNRITDEELEIAQTLNSDFTALRRIYVGTPKGFRYYKYYKITAIVKDKTTNVINTDKIIIYLSKPPIQAIISSNGYLINILQDVTLSSTNSLIPEQGKDVVTYSWKCRIAEPILAGRSCTCPYFLAAAIKSQNLLIDKTKLKSFCRYVFSLALTSASTEFVRYSNAQIEFIAYDHQTEIIKEKIIEPSVTLSNELYLSFDPSATLNAPLDQIKYEWSIVEINSLAPGITEKHSVKGNFTYNFFKSIGINLDTSIMLTDTIHSTPDSNLTEVAKFAAMTPKFLTSLNEPVLGIDKSTLAPQNSYTFAVKFTGMGAPTFQFLKLNVPPAPRKRVFTVTPQYGIGFSTTFLLTWTMTSTVQIDNAEYQLFTRNCPGSQNPLSPLTTKIYQSNSFSTLLAPAYKACNETLEIILRVYEYGYFIDVPTSAQVTETQSPIQQVLISQIDKLIQNKDLTVDQKVTGLAQISAVKVSEKTPESQKVAQAILDEISNIGNQANLLKAMQPKEQVEFLSISNGILANLAINQQLNIDLNMAKSMETQVDSYLTKVKTIEGGTYIIPSTVSALSGISDIASSLQKQDNFSSSIQYAMNNMTQMKMKEMIIGSAGYKATSPSLELSVYKKFLTNSNNESLVFETSRGTNLEISTNITSLLRSLISITTRGTPAIGAAVYSTMFNPYKNIKKNTNIILDSMTMGSNLTVKTEIVKMIYDGLKQGKLNETVVNVNEIDMPIVQLKLSAYVKSNNGSEIETNFTDPINDLPPGQNIPFTIALPETEKIGSNSNGRRRALESRVKQITEDLNNTLLVPIYYEHKTQVWSNENCSMPQAKFGEKNLKMSCTHMGKKNIDMNNAFSITVDITKDVLNVIAKGNYEQLANFEALTQWNEKTIRAYATVGGIGLIVVITLLILQVSDVSALYDIRRKCVMNKIKPQKPPKQTNIFAKIMLFYKKLRKRGTESFAKKSQNRVKSAEFAKSQNEESGNKLSESSVDHNEVAVIKKKEYKKSDGFSILNKDEKQELIDVIEMFRQCVEVFDEQETDEIMTNELANNKVVNRITHEYIDNMMWQEDVSFWTIVKNEHEFLNAVMRPELKTPRPSKFLIFTSIIVGELFTTGYFFDSSENTSISENTNAFLGKAVVMSIAATVLMIPLKIFIGVFMTGAEIKEGMTREEIASSERKAPVFKKIGNIFGGIWIAFCLYSIFMYMVAFPGYALNNWMTSFGMSTFSELFVMSTLKVLVKSAIGLILMAICRTKFMMTAAGVMAGKVVDCILRYF